MEFSQVTGKDTAECLLTVIDPTSSNTGNGLFRAYQFQFGPLQAKTSDSGGHCLLVQLTIGTTKMKGGAESGLSQATDTQVILQIVLAILNYPDNYLPVVVSCTLFHCFT